MKRHHIFVARSCCHGDRPKPGIGYESFKSCTKNLRVPRMFTDFSLRDAQRFYRSPQGRRRSRRIRFRGRRRCRWRWWCCCRWRRPRLDSSAEDLDCRSSSQSFPDARSIGAFGLLVLKHNCDVSCTLLDNGSLVCVKRAWECCKELAGPSIRSHDFQGPVDSG